MDKQIAELWVKALRSGEYKQGVSVLRNSYNEFCCLGVLCNIHAEHHPKIASRENDPVSYLGNKNILPWQVAKWAGMISQNGKTYKIKFGNADYPCLAKANDNFVPFSEIANFIEKNYEFL